eukprot:11271475-Alexandrium_andersonii.AAC.1
MAGRARAVRGRSAANGVIDSHYGWEKCFHGVLASVALAGGPIAALAVLFVMVLGVSVSQVAHFLIQVLTAAAPALEEELPTYVCTEA